MAGIDLSQKKKVAFVCSGGAVKAAAFHVGVALALEQRGFRFLGGARDGRVDEPVYNAPNTIQTYVGSSAGALVTTFLAQGGNLKKLVSSFQEEESAQGIPGLRYWEMLFPRVRGAVDLASSMGFLKNLVRNRAIPSLFSTEGITRYMREHILTTDRFSDLEADLFIVATELNQSRKAIFGRYRSVAQEPQVEWRNDVSISDACSASMALPPIYHPYPISIEGHLRDYYDGEILEPLSVHVARDTGCDLLICSYTHQPVRMGAHGSLSAKGVEAIVLQAIYQAIEQKIQAARSGRQKEKVLLDRVRKICREENLGVEAMDHLMAEIESRLTYRSNVDYIYIHPRPSDIEMFDLPHFSLRRKKTERIVKKGYLAAMSSLKGLDVDGLSV